MRPLRLSMTAFGPYAATETVDFDALTELGLFVVAGNNGSGKTTIFDALHYSLFGTLPGRRATYVRLKSDHATDSTECSVTLDFSAHGKYWRVERSPKQKRPKRRGNGFTTVDRRATLYRLDKGLTSPATAVANKIGDVDQQCRDLVGLSGKQLERVALLPQGEFSRVLRESSSDRRELLRTLFSSELFDNATSDLATAAAKATAADRSVLERIEHQRGALARELSMLVNHTVTTSPGEIRGAIANYRRVQLCELTTQVQQTTAAADSTSHALRAAIELDQRITRRTELTREQNIHLQGQSQHQLDMDRLRLARSAVPVTSHARARAQQQQRLRQGQARVAEVRQQLDRALSTAAVAPLASGEPAAVAATQASLDATITALATRHELAMRASDLQAATNRLRADERRVGNDIASLETQREVALAQQRQSTIELGRLDELASIDEAEADVRNTHVQLAQRTELHDVETQHQQLMGRAVQLDTTIDQMQIDHERALKKMSALPGLESKAESAVAQLKECSRRHDAARSFQLAATQLVSARASCDAAQQTADRLWDAFISGTASRIASALVDDEPCPVCGSAEHPSPASAPDSDVDATEDDVSNARAEADRARCDQRDIEIRIEAMRTTDPDIAALVVTELEADINTAKAMALGARALADETHQHAAHVKPLSEQLTRARALRESLADELRHLDSRRNHLQGALGETALSSVDEVQHRFDQATLARSQAEHVVERRASLTADLRKLSETVVTIDTGKISAEGRRVSIGEQIAEREQAHSHVVDQLAEIDSALSESSQAAASERYEQRAQAARRAHELLALLATTSAVCNEAADHARRAESILAERLAGSPFATADQALAAFIEPSLLEQLEAQTTAYVTARDRLEGQLQEFVGLPDAAPDLAEQHRASTSAADAFDRANRALIAATSTIDRLESDLDVLDAETNALQTAGTDTRRLERVAALVKGDNDKNTSLENWVLGAHLRDVVELANIRLARSTHQRFQLCVLDDGENKRGKWGLDLGVEDTVTGTRRPTAGLSGGELFQASLALALGLADAVMNQSAGVRIDALFIDEGFGALDETSVERAIDLLDELRDRGAMVGVITHVPALLDALPLGVHVVDAPDGSGSTIRQERTAA